MNPKLRMHAMHAAALIGVVGVLGGLGMSVPEAARRAACPTGGGL